MVLECCFVGYERMCTRAVKILGVITMNFIASCKADFGLKFDSAKRDVHDAQLSKE